MAIAFDASGNIAGGAQTTELTESITVGSGSNRIGLVYVQIQSGSTLSSITWGGTAMTQLGSASLSIGTFDYGYIYYIKDADMSSGSTNIVVTPSANAYVYIQAGTYEEVDQTNPFGSTPTYTMGTPATDTSHTESITTTVVDAWLVGMAQSQNTAMSAGTNTTFRAGGDTWMETIDSNGGQGATGSKSLNFTASNANHNIMMAQLAPAAASSSIKSVNGLAQASIKSWNGLAEASIKSINGVSNV